MNWLCILRADLRGLRTLVTAGPTVEDIDPVRFISNRSSGLMGVCLAQEAARRGADVILIHGPLSVGPPRHQRIACVPVRGAVQMHDQVMRQALHCHVAIMAAAVADFTPAHKAEQKIKKQSADETWTLELVRTPDILAELGTLPEGERPLLVGFAAESEQLDANARAKLERKRCDLLCANDISQKDSGFAVSTNRVTLYSRDGDAIPLPLMTKNKLAHRIWDRIDAMLPASPRPDREPGP